MFARLLIACIVVLAGPSTTASAPYDLDIEFVQIGDDEALPDGVVTSLAQDVAGFLWIGTADGLVRHDGHRFRRHVHVAADPHTLPGNFVRALLAAADGRLWVGTDEAGVAVYDPRSERFGVVGADDGSGDVLVGSVRALAEAADGTLYVGSIGGGVYRLPPRSTALRHMPLFTDDVPAPDERVQALLVDRDDTLWVGHWKGVSRVGGGDAPRIEHTFLAGTLVTALLQAEDGRIWVGTANGAVAVIDPERGDVHSVSTRLAGRGMVFGFAQTRDGQVWVGRNGGLSVLEGDSLEVVGRLRQDPSRPWGLSGSEVRAVLVDRAGLLWVGGYDGGLQRHNPGNRAIRVLRPRFERDGERFQPSITAVFQRDDRELWLGTAGGGVFVLDPALRVRGSIPRQRGDTGFGSGWITAFADAGDGGTWVGADAGLFRVDADGRIEDLRAGRGVRRLHAAADGTLWIGMTDGLFRRDAERGTIEAVTLDDGSGLGVAVNAIVEDDAGRMWVATTRGLYLRGSGEQTLRRVRSPAGSGLASERVIGLLVDSNRRLWIDTADGLNRLRRVDGDLAEFDDISGPLGIRGQLFGASLLEDARGRIWTYRHMYDPGSGQLVPIGPADGVGFGTGWFRSYAATADGRLLFGGSRGLLVIDPEAFRPWQHVSPVVVSELRIDGVRQPAGALTDGLVLAPDQRGFSIEYAALDFSAPRRSRHAHRLLGVDEDWVNADPGWRVASYGDLAPGHYTLQLRGSNRSGEWNPEPLTIPVEVLPAWWQTWTFRIAALLAAVAMVILPMQLRTAVLRRRERELEAQVQQRTAQLQAISDALLVKSRALEEASLTDPLTGLRNRRYLTQCIDRDLALAVRRHEDARLGRTGSSNPDLVFFLIDIDHFKQINDVHGHAAGDAVLAQMRDRLRRVFRDTDHLVRWGGEEFLAVARAISRHDAATLAERVRRCVNEAEYVIGRGMRLQCTCSIGFAAFPFLSDAPRALSWHDVVALADHALYRAKRGGRDAWVGIGAGPGLAPEQLGERIRSSLATLLEQGELVVHASRAATAATAPP